MSKEKGKGGPKTAAGKALAARNAVSHGLLSPAPVVLATERVEDWQTHLQGVVRSLNADGHIETALAGRVALLLWRLGRVARYESEAVQGEQEAVEDDLAARRAAQAAFSGTAPAPLTRASARDEVRYRKSIVAALRRFAKTPAEQILPDDDAVALLIAVAEQAEVDLDAFPLPGVPQGVTWYDASRWSAGALWAAIEALAAHAESTPATLLVAALDQAITDVKKAEAALQQLEREIAHLRRERLLPDEATLAKISRYEAHLSRQLTIALHELEAIQARRQGEAAPLARLDISGAPEQT